MSGKGLRFSITASDKTKSAFGGVQNNIRKTQGLQRSWNAGLNSNRRAVQQFGFQMTDFATQVAGGQSAMLAFTQQGGQMLQFFGPAGAVMAAFLAVFGSMAIAFTRSGKALSDLSPIAGVLREDFRAIGRVLVAVREIMIDFANLVLNNMDRILITAAMLAGFMAGKWVVSFVAARLATMTLVGALGFLRAALIRTGIGALIIGAGELAYQFTRLVKGAGGFGKALDLLQAVAVQVWGRIGEAMWVMTLRTGAAFNKMKGDFYIVLQGMMDNTEWFANRTIGVFVGTYKAVVAAFSGLPDALKRVGILAMNGLLSAMEEGLSRLTDGINTLLTVGGKFPAMAIPAPDLSGLKAAVPAASTIGKDVADAFTGAFNNTYVGNGKAGGALGDLGATLISGAATATQMADALAAKLGRPITSLRDLKDALDAVDDTGKDIDIRDWFGGGAGDAGKGGKGGGGADSLKDKLSAEAKEIKAIFDDLSKSITGAIGTAFSSLTDRTKSLKDTAVTMLTTVLDKLTQTMLNPLWESLGQSLSTWAIGTPGATGFSGGFLSGALSKMMSFAGGGNTGKGSRSGGLDGRGGKLAMVHPNEQINDLTRGQGNDGGGMAVAVHIHENAAEGSTRVEQSDGRIDVFLRKMVSDVLSDGGADRAMRGRYGVKPSASGV